MLNSLIQGVFTMSFIATVIRLSTPIIFASISSFVAGSTGIGNIAVEGIMTLAALSGVLGSYLTQNALFGVFFGLLIGILVACLIAFFSMKLGAQATLVGIALNTFADSLAVFILYQFTGVKGTSATLPTKFISTFDIPIIKDIPVLGEILSGQAVITYVCWIVLILFFILMYKTPLGMRMRACGLNPNAAKTAGVNVERLQVFSLVLSGLFAALGGIYMSLNYLNIYSSKMIAGQGWMGIAANGIADGNYGLLLISALVFSVFRGVAITFSTNQSFPTDLIAAIPYIAVFVILTVVSVRNTMAAKKGHVEEH